MFIGVTLSMAKQFFSMIMKNIFLDNAQNAITSAAWFLWQR